MTTTVPDCVQLPATTMMWHQVGVFCYYLFFFFYCYFICQASLHDNDQLVWQHFQMTSGDNCPGLCSLSLFNYQPRRRCGIRYLSIPLFYSLVTSFFRHQWYYSRWQSSTQTTATMNDWGTGMMNDEGTGSKRLFGPRVSFICRDCQGSTLGFEGFW